MGVVTLGGDVRRTLASRTVVGRSAHCALRVLDARVSAEHAAVFWREGVWQVRDLGSTNGTFVGTTRIEPGERRALAEGEVMRLGARDGFAVYLVDASPPTPARAIDVVDGAVHTSEHELLLLPNHSDPVLTVFRDDEWCGEIDGSPIDIADQAVVAVGGRSFRLELPARTSEEGVDTTDASTGAARLLEGCTLRFGVSRDEEHVEITVVDVDASVALPPRTYHYTLLTLARSRLADAERGVAPAEQGWLYADDLARMLGTTKPKVNLDVCRARQQFASAGIAGAARIVERRTLTQQIRMGVAAVEVFTLAA